jgi:uncharacterized protein YkuJ
VELVRTILIVQYFQVFFDIFELLCEVKYIEKKQIFELRFYIIQQFQQFHTKFQFFH